MLLISLLCNTLWIFWSEPRVSFLVFTTQRGSPNSCMNGKSAWILVQAMWTEGNDLLAFQNIPMPASGARAVALIGESLKRCFRAQWRCYHMVSGLNGLPIVCLKGFRNDRDKLITRSLQTAQRATRPSHGWTDLFRHGQQRCEYSSTMGRFRALISPLHLCTHRDWEEKKVVIPPCPSPYLSLPSSVQNRYF